MKARPDPQDICETCHRLFYPATGAVVEGWAKVKWVTAGPNLCAKCKGEFIDRLEKAVPHV